MRPAAASTAPCTTTPSIHSVTKSGAGTGTVTGATTGIFPLPVQTLRVNHKAGDSPTGQSVNCQSAARGGGSGQRNCAR